MSMKQALMPDTALPSGSTTPLSVSMPHAETMARLDRMDMTKSGLIAGTGLAATAAMVALRGRKDVS